MILYRYFLNSIFSYTATISLIFILVIVSSRSIQYLEQAARGEINAEIVFTVVLFRLPEFLELILPLSFFLSIVLTIGRLRSDSEFLIMEQAGFSNIKVYSLLAIPALLISILLIFFTIFLNPTLDKRVSELLQVKSLEDTFNTLSPGEFHKLNASYLIFAQERQENFLSNIFLVDINTESDKRNILVAEKFISPSPDDYMLTFESGYSYSGEESDQLISLGFGSMSLHGKNASNNKHTKELKENNFSNSLTWAVSNSFMIIVTMFIAFPLSQNSPRSGRYARVLPGLLIFSIYAGLLLSLKGEVIQNLIYLMSLHSLFLILAILLNYRMLSSKKN